MNAQPRFFAPLARLLHWLMALMIIAIAIFSVLFGAV